jgi:hypothetical protein
MATRLNRALTLTALMGLSLLACDKEKGLKGEISALTGAGHTAAGFAASDPAPLRAKTCQAGTIDRLAALLCQFETADAVSGGQAGAEAWIGQAMTGVVLRREAFLLALADREQVDRNGKLLAAITRSFKRTPPTK